MPYVNDSNCCATYQESKMAPYIAPEPDSRVGFWGKATSTLDWCEENYALSELVAEFCKHLVSLTIIHDIAIYLILVHGYRYTCNNTNTAVMNEFVI